MTEIGFYQLTTRPLDAVLPRLLEKALDAGHRAVVPSLDGALLARLDTALWSYAAASFLPHAVDGPDAAKQPVLLTAGEGPPANAADLLAVVDGALPGDLAAYKRVLYLFDGSDADALALARRHWKALAGRDGVSATYWREGDGGWEKAG